MLRYCNKSGQELSLKKKHGGKDKFFGTLEKFKLT